MKIVMIAVTVWMLALGSPAAAEYYSYMNDAQQYVITREVPTDPSIEYAVLSDRGEFVRSVAPRTEAKRQNVPIGHWQPWFIPKEPHPFDQQLPDTDPVPTVTIDEMDAESP